MMNRKVNQTHLTQIARFFLASFLLALNSGCSILSDLTSPPQGPTPIPVPSPTPLPATEVTFSVIPPDGTPANANLALVLLDEVTGSTFNTTTIAMERLNDGRWQARYTPPVGSLLRYRYIRRDPILADEATTYGEMVSYRIGQIPGPIQFDDIIAAWTDTPYQNQTGRIIGRIFDTQSGAPLPEMIVSAVGISDFTDGEGVFRLDNLPPGLHNLVVFSPKGAYRTVQQGAVIAAESTTPVELGLQPATKVQVTFQVSVPSDTITGTPVRIAGNVQQLGHRFGNLTRGHNLSISHMPTLTLIDQTHYLAVATLYAGTDLRYKYTLGDGLWNAERDREGFFTTRQVILPENDLILEDTVSSWHSEDGGSLRFQLKVPENTPPTDLISLQFKSFEWYQPIPLWRLGEDDWFYILHGPLNFPDGLAYRYCRNLQCGSADDALTFGSDAPGRLVTPSNQTQDITDEIEAWQWWDPDQPSTTVVAPEITARPDFEAGVAFLPTFHPTWVTYIPTAMNELAVLGANTVILSPAWVMEQNNPYPTLNTNPWISPFQDDLHKLNEEAVKNGLTVVLRPSLIPANGDLTSWWSESARDPSWWTVWFEAYRSFILTYANVAKEIGINKFILGGPEVTPALPQGALADGSPSGVPENGEAQWQNLIDELRRIYPGKLGFEIELGEKLQIPPTFLDSIDEIFVYWHAPLTEGQTKSFTELQSVIGSLMDEQLLNNPLLLGKPIVLNVEYLSVGVSASACAKAPDDTCRPPSAFNQGAIVDQDLERDLEGQAEVINAMILETYARPQIRGFYVRGYNPVVVLQDKSASVNGKPAQDVLWYWYPRLTAP